MVCSFCGSMHPEDLRKALKRVDGIAVWVELNDRGDKLYIHRPEVKNASEGAIKFKLLHCHQQALLGNINAAIVLSRQKSEERAAHYDRLVRQRLGRVL